MTRSWIGRIWTCLGIWTCLEGACRRSQLLDKIRVRDPFLALFLALTLLLWGDQPAIARGGAVQVDAELVFAVDVSYSMDQAEQVLQRNGYAEALVSEQFLQALKGGLYGKIAIAYLQWASYRDQDVILPWTLIDGPESAAAAAAKLRRAPYRRAQRTSVSGAIDSSMYLFENNGYDGLRRIIDVSGDGPNNDGRPVEAARDAAVAAGVTINGLPLVGIRPLLGYADIAELDLYYQDCVIGGDGAFMIAIHDRKAFVDATRTKLVQEIAAPLIRPQSSDILPAQARPSKTNCMIGEILWNRRWRN